MGMGDKRNRFVLPALLCLCFILGSAAPGDQVFAAEGYGSHYPGGNEDFMAGALPPAGTSIFINYLMFYNANTLRGESGHEAGIGPWRSPKVDFKLTAVANAFRFIRVTNVKILGGDLLWHVIVPVVYQKVSMDASPAVDLGSQSTTNLGDIEAGVGIAWHPSKTFHHVAALDFVAPTGEYHRDDLSNIGRNYWSINPLWAFTYLGDKDSPIPGFEVSAKLIYWFNTINTATSYTSGQEFSMDYLVGQHFGDWALGLNGYFMYQTTNDKQYGSTARDPFTGEATGVKSKYFSIGPAISYNIPHGCLTLKYQKDVWAENRPEGDKLWLKWTYVF